MIIQQKKLTLPKGVFIRYKLEKKPCIYVLSNGKHIHEEIFDKEYVVDSRGHVKKKRLRSKKRKSRSRKRMNDGYIINVNQNYVPFGCKVPKAFI